MVLEAVWLKNGKEVFRVSPMMNIVCDENMNNVNEIEVSNGYDWYNIEELGIDADDFIIRVEKD